MGMFWGGLVRSNWRANSPEDLDNLNSL
uniref:Uncharacterized protein n=1 Tax=Rhizophora mucronata TaxID=61149 RepID=A0A2P2QCA4_RHIMU